MYILYEKGLEGFEYFVEDIEYYTKNDNTITINNYQKTISSNIKGNISDIPFEFLDKTRQDYLKKGYKKSCNFIFNISIEDKILRIEESDFKHIKILNQYTDFEFLNDKNDHYPFDLPSFMKLSHFEYKGYDIEWIGELYQSEEYFMKLYFLQENFKTITEQIDDFLLFKDDIPISSSFYYCFDYDIKIDSFKKRYPSFPYGYSIKIYHREWKASGISNVFETIEEAIKKACLACFWDLHNKYKDSKKLEVKQKLLTEKDIESFDKTLDRFSNFLIKYNMV